MSNGEFRANDICVTFRSGRGRTKVDVRALNNVSLRVGHGEIVGLVGESGSGKSTLARVIIGLTPHGSGELFFNGNPLQIKRTKRQKRDIQMVFQDPYASLDPRMTVRQTLDELLRAHGSTRKREREAQCQDLMELVRLPTKMLGERPHGMSGGQRQRVAIARALVLNPQLLIADEAVSALDVSVQAGIINLLHDLSDDLNLSILFISHDLAVVRSICDRVAVIHLGEIVEEAETSLIFSNPQNSYTRQLLDAVPRLAAARNREDTSGSNAVPREAFTGDV